MTSGVTDMPTLTRLDELAYLLEHGIEEKAPIYLRYSPGPVEDAAHPSRDHESGLLMPGVSVNPLRPPKWWTRSAEDWLARRVCQYLREVHEGARPWVLTGDVVDYGPDNEPLLVNVVPIAWLSVDLVRAAHRHYQEQLDAGQATHAG